MKAKKRKMVMLLLCTLLICSALASCGTAEVDEQPSLVGSWVGEEYSDFVYTFHEDGTGDYSIAGASMPFTYEDTGSEVSILFEGNTAASTYSYSIEGDKFLFEDSFGQTVVYVKQ